MYLLSEMNSLIWHAACNNFFVIVEQLALQFSIRSLQADPDCQNILPLQDESVNVSVSTVSLIDHLGSGPKNKI